MFEGFISTSKTERRERLAELASDRRTVIIYEAPHKLRTTLNDLLEFFGDRKITLCRELTKLNEEVIRTTIPQAVENIEKQTPEESMFSLLKEQPQSLRRHIRRT